MKMMMKQVLTILSFLCLASCFFYPNDFKRSQSFLKKGNCKKSYKYFSLVEWSENKKKFLIQAARICSKKDTKIGALFYQELLLHTKNVEKKMQIQKKLIAVFLKSKNYRNALVYYQKLLSQAKTDKEKADIKYKMGQVFFALNKYDQVLIEINEVLDYSISLENKKSALLLKGRTLVAKGEHEKSIEFFRDQIKSLPQFANSFFEYIAFIFEEKGQLRLAIKELEKIHPQTVFIRNKIQKLSERIKNQGATSL